MNRIIIRLLLIILYLLLTFTASFSQIETEDHLYLNDVEVNYGRFITIKDKVNPIIDNIKSLHGSHFFNSSIGIRSGITYYPDFQSAKTYMEFPVYFCFKTRTKDFEGGSSNSLAGLLLSSIFMWFPYRFEFNVGTNFGYLVPEASTGMHRINRKFVSSLDFLIRYTTQIERIGFVLSPHISYKLTNNFLYHDAMNTPSDTYQKVFLSFTIGLSYRFSTDRRKKLYE